VTEAPYAEWFGDRPAATRHAVGIGRNDEACLANLYRANPNRPIVVLVIAGRPIELRGLLTGTGADARGARGVRAVVTAWLPGGVGGGVADVLWGRAPANGTLPVQYAGAFPLGWSAPYPAAAPWPGCGCTRGPGSVPWITWIAILASAAGVLLCSACACLVRCCACVRVVWSAEDDDDGAPAGKPCAAGDPGARGAHGDPARERPLTAEAFKAAALKRLLHAEGMRG